MKILNKILKTLIEFYKNFQKNFDALFKKYLLNFENNSHQYRFWKILAAIIFIDMCTP